MLMKTNTYYDGIVGKTHCSITSRIWSFGSHHIPIHAVSDVIAARLSFTVAIIVCCVLALLSFIGWGAYTDFDFDIEDGTGLVILMILFILIAVILARYKKVVITVVSKGMKHVIIDASGSAVNDAINLYKAMLTCLNDGEVYDVRLDIFEDNLNENNTASQISGTIEKVDTQIECPDCGAIIPNGAKACPNCGCPESVFNNKN